MKASVTLTVLMDDSVHQRGLQAEHGWALLLDLGGHRVLFDTGQTDLLLVNADRLGLSLTGLEAVVLSHGHYDHTGGLPAVLRSSPQARVCLHPAALAPKYAPNADGGARTIGLPPATQQALAASGSTVQSTSTVAEVVPGLYATGEIPRCSAFEDVGGRFFLDAACAQPDPLVDDQALFFETAEGVVVLLGCAHAGVVNTLQHVQRLTDGKRFRAIIGGMHLLHASTNRLDATMQALRDYDVPLLVPAHCTGWPATARLWSDFPGRCQSAGVGSRWEFATRASPAPA